MLESLVGVVCEGEDLALPANQVLGMQVRGVHPDKKKILYLQCTKKTCIDYSLGTK